MAWCFTFTFCPIQFVTLLSLESELCSSVVMMDRILGKNDLTETKKSTNGEKDKNGQVKQM